MKSRNIDQLFRKDFNRDIFGGSEWKVVHLTADSISML